MKLSHRTFFLLPILLVGFFIALPSSAAVVINEIQIGGESSTDEFIELYNNGSESVNLNGWRLSKRTASGTESNLLTTFPEISLYGNTTLVISHANFTGNAELNYSTQNSIASNNTIILYSDSGDTVIDTVGMGDATSFETATAPVPENSKSISRTNGQDINNNAADFIITNPTPGISSSTPTNDNKTETPTPTTGVNPSSPNTNFSVGSIVINEFVSDPNPDEDEWIELFNTTADEILLDDWTIEDGSGKQIKLTGNISAENFFVIDNPTFALNNTGDIIILRLPDQKIINEVAYGDWDDGNTEDNAPKAGDPNSTALDNSGKYIVSTNPTKGTKNIISETTEDESPKTVEKEKSLIISELFPNPSGDEQYEYIEIYNESEKAIDLKGWRLTDSDGQKFTWRLPSLIQRHQFLTLYRTDSRIALNNFGGETIKLFAPNSEKAVSTASYKGTAERQLSWSLIDDKWIWTPTITPGDNNFYKPPNQPPTLTIYAPAKVEINEAVVFSAEDTYDIEGDPFFITWDLGDGNKAVGDLVFYSYTKAGEYSVTAKVWQGKHLASQETFMLQVGESLPIAKVTGTTVINNQIETADTDDKFLLSGEVQINGIVTAGIKDIELNIIYLGEISESVGGIRVDIPEGIGFEINRGDKIQVSGKVRNVAGEPRLTVTNVENIKFIESTTEPEPQQFYDDITEQLIGELVSVSGTINKGTSAGFYLDNEDGQIRVVVPKRITPKRPFPTGTEITVTGLLSKTSAGYRILTRDENDVISYAPELNIVATPITPIQPWYTNSNTILIVGIIFIALAGFYQLQKQQQKRLQPEVVEEEIDF